MSDPRKDSIRHNITVYLPYKIMSSNPFKSFKKHIKWVTTFFDVLNVMKHSLILYRGYNERKFYANFTETARATIYMCIFNGGKKIIYLLEFENHNVIHKHFLNTYQSISYFSQSREKTRYNEKICSMNPPASSTRREIYSELAGERGARKN